MVWEPVPRATSGGLGHLWPVPMAPLCSRDSPRGPLENEKAKRNFITVRDWNKNPYSYVGTRRVLLSY
jgi:hypothetical protein